MTLVYYGVTDLGLLENGDLEITWDRGWSKVKHGDWRGFRVELVGQQRNVTVTFK